MKHLLPLLFIIIFNFSAFAQIEKSDWEGKTVLMVVKDDSTSLSTDTKYYNSCNNELSKNWYLTNSIKYIPRSLLNPNLDKVGQDTILILWESNWEKIILSTRNCDSPDPYDCLNWTLGESYQFRNFQNGNWEMYIFPLYNKEHDNLKKLQQLITNSSYNPTYEGKTIIVKNRVWSEEIEELINNRFQNTELKTVMSFGNEYSDDNYIDYDNAIYIYKRNFRNSDYIEIIDLKTNRVIEKIELEKPKPKILFYLENLADSAWYQQWSDGYEYLFTQDTFYLNQPKYISKDTILVIEKKTFVKELIGVNCESPIEDCLFWGLHLKYNISNSTTGQFDEYIIIKNDSVEVFSRFIRSIPTLHEQSKKVDLSNRNFFVDDLQSNSARIEAALLKRLGSLDDVSFYPVLYRIEHLTDKWIYVCVENFEYIKLVDLKTNRVIEKIELEPK